MTNIRIEIAQPNELPVAASLASHAMIDLPENKVVFYGNRHRLEAYFRILFTKCPGKVMLAKDGDFIAGIMRIVEYPECQMPPKLALRLFPQMVYTIKGSIYRGIKLQKLWGKYDPQEYHWHLGPIAVAPEMQGKGIGGLMMVHFCKFIDSQNSAGYLETGTEKNVRFYKRFGFSVIDKAQFYDAVTWFMLRQKSGNK